MRSGVERGAKRNVHERNTQSCGELFFGPLSVEWFQRLAKIMPIFSNLKSGTEIMDKYQRLPSIWSRKRWTYVGFSIFLLWWFLFILWCLPGLAEWEIFDRELIFCDQTNFWTDRARRLSQKHLYTTSKLVTNPLICL